MENTESRVMSFDEFVKHEKEMSGEMSDAPTTEPAETEMEPTSEDPMSMEEPANPEPEVQIEEPTN